MVGSSEQVVVGIALAVVVEYDARAHVGEINGAEDRGGANGAAPNVVLGSDGGGMARVIGGSLTG